MAPNKRKNRTAAQETLEPALLCAGWKKGRHLRQELRKFGVLDRAGPSLATILPKGRRKSSSEEVRKAIAAAWIVTTRDRVKELWELIDTKLGLANELTVPNKREERRRANRQALKTFSNNFSWDDYPEEKRWLKAAQASGDTDRIRITSEIVAASVTRDVPSAGTSALVVEHPEYRGAVAAFHKTILDLTKDAPSRDAAKRRHPRTIVSALALGIESEYRRVDPAERTRVVIALVHKYFPDRFTSKQVSSLMRTYRKRNRRGRG